MRHLVTLEVLGVRPATFATAGEKPWKEAVRRSVVDSGVRPVDGRFSVRIEFRTPMARTPNDAWDLDNLLKPTLDAMEGVFGDRAVRDKMVPQPADDRVDHIDARKREIAEGEPPGATIEVWVLDEDSPRKDPG